MDAINIRAAALAFLMASVSVTADINAAQARGNAFERALGPTRVQLCKTSPKASRAVQLEGTILTGPAEYRDPLRKKVVMDMLGQKGLYDMEGPLSRQEAATSTGKYVYFFQCKAHWCGENEFHVMYNPRNHKAYGLFYHEDGNGKASYRFFGHPGKVMQGYLKGFLCKQNKTDPAARVINQ